MKKIFDYITNALVCIFGLALIIYTLAGWIACCDCQF